MTERFCVIFQKNFSKPLDKSSEVWYNTRANEVKPPGFHPAVSERVAVNMDLRPGMGWVSVCRGCRFGTIFIFRRCLPIAANAKDTQTLLNEDITQKEIRVITADGEPLGIMSSKEALKIAYEKELDLVMVAPQATPPVCKIMDYGKFCFEKQKREKEAKKKQQTVELKEIQLSCRIDTHDYETKMNQAKKFLTAGNKVRVVMKFRGREMSHMAIGRDILEKFLEDTKEVGSCDKKPVLDGRFMSMVISPLSNKK